MKVGHDPPFSQQPVRENASVMPEPATAPTRVSTLELFFDLVFVFTVTQLTRGARGASERCAGCSQVALMLGAIWWMYGGYAWLTNAVAADRTSRRLLLLGGMASYLVLALAIPHAFSGSGTAFALSYLAVVLTHVALFTRSSSAGVVQAILRIAPFNVATALLVLAAGVIGGTAEYWLLGAAVTIEWISPRLVSDSGFEIGAEHFVERHGLVVLIAIGESVVAVGAGAGGHAVDLELVAVVVDRPRPLGVPLVGVLRRGRHACRARPARRPARAPTAPGDRCVRLLPLPDPARHRRRRGGRPRGDGPRLPRARDGACAQSRRRGRALPRGRCAVPPHPRHRAERLALRVRRRGARHRFRSAPRSRRRPSSPRSSRCSPRASPWSVSTDAPWCSSSGDREQPLMHDIHVYTRAGCGWCSAVKSLLRKHGYTLSRGASRRGRGGHAIPLPAARVHGAPGVRRRSQGRRVRGDRRSDHLG